MDSCLIDLILIKKTVMKKIILLLLIIIGYPKIISAQIENVYNRPVQVERSRAYNAIHYRIKLDLDFDNKYIDGENKITLSPLNDGFDICELDAEQIVVSEVLDGKNQNLLFKQTDKQLIVNLSKSYNYTDTLSLTVLYNITNPKTGLFFIDKSPTNPLMLSSGSWPDKARCWYPCYDAPNDRVTHELIVTTTNNNKVLSNGKLISKKENPEDGTVTYHWSQDLPHPTYLSMLSVAPFAVIKDSLGNLPINYWIYPKDSTDAKWIFGITPGIIEFYNDLFGYDYPWAKYDQVLCPRQGGGAEATSATILGEQVIHDRQAEQDFSWDGIIAHEIAHQWWGDLITLRTWSHTWMNESFGTYSDYLYTNWDKGEDEGAFNLLSKKNQYLREAHNRYMRPIVFERYNRIQDNFDSHTYPKGAVVLHMLRRIVGDEPFFRTLSYFLHKHEFQPVVTHDFMIAIKEVTGKNMDWFFDLFVFKPGHPVFDVSYDWDSSGNKILLRIQQKQDSIINVPIYKMPVNIGIYTSAGKSIQEICLSKKDEVFEFPAEEKPMMVRFDEGNYLLKEWTFNKNSEELLFQLENDDVIGRAWAASQLSEIIDNNHVSEQLSLKVLKDPFWAVRQASLEALSKNNPNLDNALLKKLCEDENSKVRTSSLKILGDKKDSSLIPFYKERFKKENSYVARAEIIRSIAKSATSNQKSFFNKALQMKSPRDVIKRAAEWALSQTDK